MKILNNLPTAIISAIITLVLVYAITKPMGRSEAYSILSSAGTIVSVDNTLTYYTTEVMLELELEALAKLHSNYESVRVVTNTVKQ